MSQVCIGTEAIVTANATMPLKVLYEQDETAWLEQTANLLAEHRFADVDLSNLCEYLSDMARRDKREVVSRLRTLLAHLLKWEHQPENRSNSWRGTIRTQRRELEDLLESATLRHHAEEMLDKAYAQAVEQAADETGMQQKTFPAECSKLLDEVLTQELEK